MHFSGSGLHILCAYACRHGACSVTPQQENALRSIARQANSEIKKVRQQFPDKNVNDICRSVLKKHRETVTMNMKSKIIRELQAPFLLFAFTLKRINQQFRD
ncbi:hypothetical protein R9K25_22950 [Escherichia coli]